MGAWIETFKPCECEVHDAVAPRVGAWIETKMFMACSVILMVAPRVGAWIETSSLLLLQLRPMTSHPVWVRGLKHEFAYNSQYYARRTPCGCVD